METQKGEESAESKERKSVHQIYSWKRERVQTLMEPVKAVMHTQSPLVHA